MTTINDRLDSLEESSRELAAAVKTLADVQQEHTRILSQNTDTQNRLTTIQSDQSGLLTQIVAIQTQLAAIQNEQGRTLDAHTLTHERIVDLLNSIVSTLQSQSTDLTLIKAHLG